MQTLSDVALAFVKWRRTDLPGGVYRIDEVQTVAVAPVLDGYADCIDSNQFADCLACAKLAAGITGGIWVGVEKVTDAGAEVTAIKLE